MRDGWYWTGDLAYRDAEGYLYFAGRRGDWMRVDSENFAAGPIERVLVRHPDVAAAAVYAVPDPRSGDQVMAALELLPGQRVRPRAASPRSWPPSRIWAPSGPRRICGSPTALPQTATGKVTKAPLRAEGWWRGGDPLFCRVGPPLAYVPLSADRRSGLLEELRRHGRSTLIGATG